MGPDLQTEYQVARKGKSENQGENEAASYTYFDGAYVSTIKNDAERKKISRVQIEAKNSIGQGDADSQMTKEFAEEAYGFKVRIPPA